MQYCNTSFHFISAAGKKKLFCLVIGKHCPGMQEEVHLAGILSAAFRSSLAFKKA
jgi:hypothetical protein